MTTVFGSGALNLVSSGMVPPYWPYSVLSVLPKTRS